MKFARFDDWRMLSAVALAASLAHVLIDFHVGLYGPTSKLMSVPEAAAVGSTALAYGVWAYVIAAARAGDRSSLAGVLAFAAFWSLLANGIVALFVAPPPSAAFPYQDAAHIANVVCGGLAVRAAWRALAAAPGRVEWRAPLLVIALMLLAYIGQNAAYLFR